jgi:hypothetical protein
VVRGLQTQLLELLGCLQILLAEVAAGLVVESQPVRVVPLLVVLEVLTLETVQTLQPQIQAVVAVEVGVLLVLQFPVATAVLES